MFRAAKHAVSVDLAAAAAAAAATDHCHQQLSSRWQQLTLDPYQQVRSLRCAHLRTTRCAATLTLCLHTIGELVDLTFF